jgi:hypothetical protein
VPPAQFHGVPGVICCLENTDELRPTFKKFRPEKNELAVTNPLSLKRLPLRESLLKNAFSPYAPFNSGGGCQALNAPLGKRAG